jgi:transketolase
MRNECIRAVEEMALSDPRVCVVASDPSPDLMPELLAKHPERLFIEGVCEQALVGMAAGLASEGFYPYVVMLAVFGTRRCYEQLLLDFGLHGLSGCIVGIGGGFNYAPLGPTHISVDDIMLFSGIPGSAILTPGEPEEAIALTKSARTYRGLSYMRLTGTTDSIPNATGDVVLGKGRQLGITGSVLFVSCGAATLGVQAALPLLKQSGVDASAIHLHTVKPLDVDLIRRSTEGAKAVICVEEHRQVGGMASAVLHALTTSESRGVPGRFLSVGVDDNFPWGYGSYEDLTSYYGLTGPSLADRAIALLLP